MDIGSERRGEGGGSRRKPREAAERDRMVADAQSKKTTASKTETIEAQGKGTALS